MISAPTPTTAVPRAMGASSFGVTMWRTPVRPAMARVRAAKVHPFLMVGGTILALGVPHLALGMAAPARVRWAR